jgi:hypothetical protein
VKHRVCRMGKIRSDLMDFKVIKGGQWLLWWVMMRWQQWRVWSGAWQHHPNTHERWDASGILGQILQWRRWMTTKLCHLTTFLTWCPQYLRVWSTMPSHQWCSNQWWPTQRPSEKCWTEHREHDRQITPNKQSYQAQWDVNSLPSHLCCPRQGKNPARKHQVPYQMN